MKKSSQKSCKYRKKRLILKDVTIYSEINGLFVKNEIASFIKEIQFIIMRKLQHYSKILTRCHFWIS